MIIPNILCSVSARPKRGKTTFSLTWPEPICVFAFDVKGVKEIVAKFPGKKITVMEYPIPILDSPTTKFAIPVWKKFSDEYRAACESPDYNTVVIDTATTLWSVVCHATFEEEYDPKKGRLNYTGANLRMSSVFGRAVVGGKNLVVLHHMKEKFVGQTATGEDTLAGWKGTDGAADVVVEMDKHRRTIAATKDTPARTITDFVLEFIEVRPDPNIEGMKLVNATYDDLITVLGYGG